MRQPIGLNADPRPQAGMRRSDRAVAVMARRTPWILRGRPALTRPPGPQDEQLRSQRAPRCVRAGFETLRPLLWGRPMAQFRQFAVLAVACALSGTAPISGEIAVAHY